MYRTPYQKSLYFALLMFALLLLAIACGQVEDNAIERAIDCIDACSPQEEETEEVKEQPPVVIGIPGPTGKRGDAGRRGAPGPKGDAGEDGYSLVTRSVMA